MTYFEIPYTILRDAVSAIFAAFILCLGHLGGYH
jgi:hypothetical protein